jgi:cysteine-rich repeat protein
VCGNSVREPGEQCDDGNTINLDGCDSTCQFEQDQRLNALTLQFGTDSDCPLNALGSAIASLAQGQLQQALSAGVADGSVTAAYKLFGLTDLSGNSGTVQIGVVHGSPIIPSASADGGVVFPDGGAPVYDGTKDLEWWYHVDPLSIDANRVPTAMLSGTISNHVLTASGNASLTLNLAGQPAQLNLTGIKLRSFIATPPTTPTMSATGTTPGHLASEHLDPMLASFASTGGSAGTNKLCGNITAASLANIPVPQQLASGGSNACGENYTTSGNSLLDVFVGGCTVFIIQVVSPTQPDTLGGDTYVLSTSGTRHVSACSDNGNTIDLATCLGKATYSSYLQFTTDRVILKP